MHVKLKVLSGNHSNREVSVSTEVFLIGRGEQCQLRPKSESVSRRHCAIVVKEGRVYIQDLNSRNGTFVNGKRLPPDKAKSIKDGDKLTVGKLDFELMVDFGLGGTKKPEVRDVSDAVERVVATSDSKSGEVDVSSWLEEADQIDRTRKVNDPETRQLRLDETHYATASATENTELSIDEPAAKGDESKGDASKDAKTTAPNKLPKRPQNQSENSRDAAGQALKRFFGGR
jgi:pSer/pThr/pTyr-binding forkhead associated (FHA) protein